MFQDTVIDASSKAAFYEAVAKEARHLMEGETNAVANLSNVSALLNVHLENINWVGFYLMDKEAGELVLGPFQGKPACIRIPVGRGVCGTAVAEKKSIVVADVFAFPGHIACDAASRSEVVVPLVRNGEVLGVLDIDAPMPERFSDEDAFGLQKVVDAIVEVAGL